MTGRMGCASPPECSRTPEWLGRTGAGDRSHPGDSETNPPFYVCGW